MIDYQQLNDQGMPASDALELADFRVSRRMFLGSSAGLLFGIALGGCATPGDGTAARPVRLNAYVGIAPDGTITIQSPAAEMGQGIMTGLPLIVAEELDADWSKVKVEQAPTDAAYHHPIFKAQYVVASISTLGYWTPLRIAGAQARRVLLDAAAAQWKVPVSELTTEPSVVVHAASNRRLSYGEIAAFAQVPAQMPAIDTTKDLKPVNRFRLVGKGVPRVDVAAKTTGTARYGIDVQVPGMVYATLVRPPVRDSAPANANADALKKMAGVVDVVVLPHAVAIVGDTFDNVRKARRALQVSWRTGAPGDAIDSDRDLEGYLAQGRDLKRTGVEWKSKGETAKAIAGAARVVSREYESDHVYHAQMEPMNSTVHVRGDTAEVWVGTQAPTRTAIDVAKAIGTTEGKVTVHQHLLGGGYGRRATVEASVDAALVSKAVGRPVKLILSREDDLAAGTFRPMTAQRIDVGLDAKGDIVGWRHRVVGEPVGDFVYHKGYNEKAKNRDTIFMMGAELPYYDRVPNWLSEHVMTAERARVAAWRGIGAGYTKFAIESMLDEIATERKVDPIAFRLSLTGDQRARRLIEKVRDMSEWSRRRTGTALGMAFTEYGVATPKFGSMCAAVAEISVDAAAGKIRVHNYWAAVDAGVAVNPDAFLGQVESAIVWGLSSTLTERVSIKGGVVQQTNFHEYEVLRMADVPQIHVEIMTSGSSPTMVGELGVPGTAPAVANAFFALTGKRLRHMPFTKERVWTALRA